MVFLIRLIRRDSTNTSTCSFSWAGYVRKAYEVRRKEQGKVQKKKYKDAVWCRKRCIKRWYLDQSALPIFQENKEYFWRVFRWVGKVLRRWAAEKARLSVHNRMSKRKITSFYSFKNLFLIIYIYIYIGKIALCIAILFSFIALVFVVKFVITLISPLRTNFSIGPGSVG